MTMPDSETYFLLRRAEEEAILAIRANQPQASDAHFDLSLRYGALARKALAETDTRERIGTDHGLRRV